MQVDIFSPTFDFGNSFSPLRYCFMEFARRSGMLSEPEFNVMDLWHKFAIRNYEPKIKPDLIRKFSPQENNAVYLLLGFPVILFGHKSNYNSNAILWPDL